MALASMTFVACDDGGPFEEAGEDIDDAIDELVIESDAGIPD